MNKLSARSIQNSIILFITTTNNRKLNTILYLKRYIEIIWLISITIPTELYYPALRTVCYFTSEMKTDVDQFEGKLIFEPSENNRSYNNSYERMEGGGTVLVEGRIGWRKLAQGGNCFKTSTLSNSFECHVSVYWTLGIVKFKCFWSVYSP